MWACNYQEPMQEPTTLYGLQNLKKKKEKKQPDGSGGWCQGHAPGAYIDDAYWYALAKEQEAKTIAARDKLKGLQNLGFSLKKVTKPIGHAATSVGKGVVKAAPTVERIAKDAAPYVPLAVAVIAL